MHIIDLLKNLLSLLMIEKDKHWQILLKKCNTSQLLQYDKSITCKNNSQYKNCRGVFTSCKIKDLTTTDISNGFNNKLDVYYDDCYDNDY